jgi:hypothetical protein
VKDEKVKQRTQNMQGLQGLQLLQVLVLNYMGPRVRMAQEKKKGITTH